MAGHKAPSYDDLLTVVGPSRPPSYEQTLYTTEESVQIFLKIAISPATCHAKELVMSLGSLLRESGVMKWRRRVLISSILLIRPTITHAGSNRVLLTYRGTICWKYSTKVRRMLEPVVLNSRQWLLLSDDHRKLFWFSGHFVPAACTTNDMNALALLMDAKGQAICNLLNITLVSGVMCGIDPYLGIQEDQETDNQQDDVEDTIDNSDNETEGRRDEDHDDDRRSSKGRIEINAGLQLY